MSGPAPVVRRFAVGFLVLALLGLGWSARSFAQGSTGPPGAVPTGAPLTAGSTAGGPRVQPPGLPPTSPPLPDSPKAAVASIAVFGSNCIKAFLDLSGFTTQLVTDTQLATPGFLDQFAALVVTRDGDSFGSGLSAAAATAVKNYVGATGRVVLFSGDWADMVVVSGCSVGDPEDTRVEQLILNAVTFAAASGHGYVGEFNGTAMAVTSNANSFNPLALIPGSAGLLGSFSDSVDTVSLAAVGINHPVTAGVVFPFSPLETSTFRTAISGVPPENVLATWADGVPAILARGAVPPSITIALTGCTVCKAGDRFIARATLENQTGQSVRVEAKLGFLDPNGDELAFSILGDRHFEFVIPPGVLGPVTVLDVPLPAGLQPGIWTLEGALLEPELGKTLSRQFKEFTVVP